MNPFEEGQAFADDVADAARERGAAELSPFVRRVLAACEREVSFNAIRDAVLQTYEDEAAPAGLADIVEESLVMAELGGRLAVNEDT